MVELLNHDGLVPTFSVRCHQARLKAVGPPGNHGVVGLLLPWLGAPQIDCLATPLHLAAGIRMAGESEALCY